LDTTVRNEICNGSAINLGRQERLDTERGIGSTTRARFAEPRGKIVKKAHQDLAPMLCPNILKQLLRAAVAMRGTVSKSCYLALLLPVMAAAQQAEPAPDSAAQLTTVMITAQKVTENLQKAPVAVTAISSQDITRSGIQSMQDLQWKLPALEFQTAQSVPDVFIRGVGTYDLQAGVDSAVAYVIDGIYLAHPSAFPPVLVDIAQVEEVRGPQGTLYGRNSNGGAVIFNTNKPVIGRWDAEAGISTGDYGHLGSDFMINVPLTDTLATRFAFGTDRHDPYYSNGGVNGNNFTGRWRVLFRPLENLTLIATLDRSRVSTNDSWVPDRCPPGSSEAACAGVSFRPWTGIGPHNPADFTAIDTWGTYLEADLSLSWGTITSLSSYRNSDWFAHQTWAIGPDPYGFTPQGVLLPGEVNTGYTQGQTSRLTTQELRIASPAGSRLTWVVGGFYSRERAPYIETLLNNNVTFFTTNPLLTDDSKAVFGQLTYPIIDGLRVTGGLRYTNEKKSAAQTEDGVFINPRNDLSKVTWKAGLEYDLAPQSMVYGSVSTGFKSGGVSEVPNFRGSSQTYGPETITAYQLGNKNRFWSDRVQVNWEIFYYDYHGFQTLNAVTDPTGTYTGLFLETLNSQKATMYGGEVETTFALTAHDRLTFSPTFLHSIFDEFDVGGVNESGNHIEASAPYTIAGSYQHEFVLPRLSVLVANISTELVGGHYMDNGNAPGSYQRTYTRTSAHLTYEDGDGHWSASAYVKNLENSAVINFYAGSTLGIGDIVSLRPPRTYGLSVDWHLQ
jgi:iron complex outermembrane recepter protein